MPPSWLFVLPLIVGAAAIYLLLPRPKAYPVLWGALLGVVALFAGGYFIVGFRVLTPESFLFYVFSAVAVVFGAMLVTQRNPARAALSFALVVLSTCGLFLLLAAPFLMAATIIIYAGAVIVTFLFVLMLAQQEAPSDADARSREPMLAAAVGFVLLGTLLYVLQLQWDRENDGQGRVLDAMLVNVGEARAGLSEETLQSGKGRYERNELLKPLIAELTARDDELSGVEERIRGIRALPPAAGAAQEERQKELAALERERLTADRARDPLHRLQQRLDPIFDEWPTAAAPSVRQVDDGLTKLQTALLQAKQQHGWPEPDGTAGKERASNLSSFSGPPPDLPAEQVRADAGGRPYMPADNPAYLGRSLFTDYLLPVELGGFLLLAAAIGAIAIAQRRTNPEGS